MIFIKVNNGQAMFNAVGKQADEISRIVAENAPDIHQKLCAELRIGQYTPATEQVPFGLIKVVLELSGAGRKVIATVGGNLVCFKCLTNLPHRSFVECPNCKATKVANYTPPVKKFTLKTTPNW